MKKVKYTIVLSFVLFGLSLGPVYADSNQNEQQIKEGTEIVKSDGWEIEITTKKATKEEFLESQKQNELEIIEGLSPHNSLEAMQNDHISGAGKKTVKGITGTTWTNDIHVGLNPVGGFIEGIIYAYAGNGAKSRARVELTTWGMVGGSIGVVKEYTFKSPYSSGTVTKHIDRNLTGAVAYYTISLYGDHKKGSTNLTSKAKLSK